jgi:hypothetical protein
MPAFDPTLAGRDPAPAPPDPMAVARLLEASAGAVAAEIRALGDLAGWTPAPGEWSANDVVGHLIESDRRGYTGRIRRILAADGVLEQAWDQEAVAAARGDRDRAGAELAAEFIAGRAEGIVLVRSLRPADLERHAVHSGVGRVTVAELLDEWVFHDRNHLRQLLATTQARVWPAMGNARQFTDPDA